MKKLNVSVCLVSGAEAHRIRRALESVAGWTSEVVVVMNEEVADGTDRIAGEFGARVFREPWKGFVGQKNSAAERATQPWILGIDADEVITPALRDEIAMTLSDPQASSRHAAFEFPRCTFYCGRWIRHGDWYPDRVIRLWRKDASRWGGQEPHARLEVQGSIGRLRSDLHHFTNDSIAHHVQKIVPYSEGFVREQTALGADPGLFEFTVRPGWRFIRAYVVRRGFLDGWQGYYIAWLNAFSTVTKYARLRERRADHDKMP